MSAPPSGPPLTLFRLFEAAARARNHRGGGSRRRHPELVPGMVTAYPILKVIGHKERSGKGRGIREAVALATGNIVGYADADDKVPIEELEKIEPWLAGGCHVVTGSRALAQSRIEPRPGPPPRHPRLRRLHADCRGLRASTIRSAASNSFTARSPSACFGAKDRRLYVRCRDPCHGP